MKRLSRRAGFRALPHTATFGRSSPSCVHERVDVDSGPATSLKQRGRWALGWDRSYGYRNHSATALNFGWGHLQRSTPA